MIPVALAPEPPDFDDRVRQPGLSAIDEFVGRPPRRKRTGPKRKQLVDEHQQPVTREEDIPANAFPPYWREVLPEMLVSYERRCAYLAMYIHPATGAPTVDHVLPKSYAWNEVYEWTNYRLCAAIINANKGALLTLVDPTEIGPGWFTLNLKTLHVEIGPSAPPAKHSPIRDTLPVLNHKLCVSEREEYVRGYWLGSATGGFDLAHLERRAPFVADELARQGFLRQVNAEWFVVIPDSLRFARAPSAPNDAHAAIDQMLGLLNDPRELIARCQLVRGLSSTPAELERRAPFLAAELRRQGALDAGDV